MAGKKLMKSIKESLAFGSRSPSPEPAPSESIIQHYVQWRLLQACSVSDSRILCAAFVTGIRIGGQPQLGSIYFRSSAVTFDATVSFTLDFFG